jgi:hypothetical protein
MLTTDRSILELLHGVRLELDSANDVDTVGLARPRAKLAWIASLISEQRPAPRRLLDLAAEVASAIGLDASAGEPDHHRLVATRAAVSAVVEYLKNPAASHTEGLVAEAGQQLMRTVGRNPSAWFQSNVEWTVRTKEESGGPQHLSLERLRTPRALHATA